MKTSLSIIAFAALAIIPRMQAEPPNDPAKYPATTCVVSDEKLGEMGKPYVFIYEGREVQLCCKDCEKEFKKDPEKFIKKLDAAEKK